MKKIYFGIILLFTVAVTAIFLLFAPVTSSEKTSQYNSPQSSVNIVITGDVMLGRGVGSAISSKPNIFGDLRLIFKQSDLVIANLESPFTYSNKNFKKTVPLKANPAYAYILKDNNIDVAALANNHIMDYGPQGLTDTLATLDKYNITHIGAGKNLQDALQPAYFNINGKRVAIINFMDLTTFQGFGKLELPPATDNSSGFAPAEWNIVKNSIDTAKSQADIVIVFFHYGNEYSLTPNKYQTELSRKCIDEGADIVVGSHPHVPQGIENYKGKIIFYSLGNCVFDQSNPITKDSMVVQLQIVNGNADVTVIPIHISNSSPKIMNNQSANKFLNRINSESNVKMDIVNGKGKLTMDI
ncbi:CapA family protein [Methanobacterium sp.]|uniref:CapA family protein n=1 Tax=Methanobacterium sp. TaxID=2164 RepID=UPI003C786E10